VTLVCWRTSSAISSAMPVATNAFCFSSESLSVERVAKKPNPTTIASENAASASTISVTCEVNGLYGAFAIS
jgi:hypothetical protein